MTVPTARRGAFYPFTRRRPIQPPPEPAPKPERVPTEWEEAERLRQDIVHTVLPAPCPVAVAEQLAFIARGDGYVVRVSCNLGDHEHSIIASGFPQAGVPLPALVMPDDPLLMTPYTLLRIFSIGALEEAAVVQLVGRWDFPPDDGKDTAPGAWKATVGRALDEGLITHGMYAAIVDVRRDHAPPWRNTRSLSTTPLEGPAREQ